MNVDAIMELIRSTNTEELHEFASVLNSFGVLSLNQLGKTVNEIYSPPRVTAMAKHFGIEPGFALDLTTNDPSDGKPLDFSDPEKRTKAEK